MHTPTIPGSYALGGFRRIGVLVMALASGMVGIAAERELVLEVQQSEAAAGPWTRVTELKIPVLEGQAFFRLGPSLTSGVTVPDSFVWIPAGTLLMGTPDSEVGRRTAEGPQTQVKISGGFWMSRYETTQREWTSVMEFNNSATVNPDLPADSISYEEATEYCAKLTLREREAGRLPAGYVYRLPTEAEWEYACRAGTTTATAFGNSLSSTNANFDGTVPYGGAAAGPSLGGTLPGGRYPANAWGLYDMHGNVWEWCMDWHPSRLPGGRVTDPVGSGSVRQRSLRGGAWHNEGEACRSGYRYLIGPIFRLASSGLRPVIAREI